MTQNILVILNLQALATGASDIPPEVKASYRLLLLLLLSITLLTVFVLTILLIRALRRYRRTFLPGPRKPTAAEDLWLKQRLPKELQDKEDSDESSQQ